MRKNNGFTLMELMVAIAIIAILTTIAIPNIISYIGNQRINRAAYEVKSAIQSTRVKAIKENSDARIDFPSSTEYQIRIWDRSSGGFIDDGAVNKMPLGVTLTTGFTSGDSYLEFGPRGTSNSVETVTINDGDGRTRQITVQISGTSKIG